MRHTIIRVLASVGALAILSAPSFGQEILKLAVGQRTLWDTSISELGQRAGIFKKHGLQLEITYTQGGGETQQAVISGSVDIGIAAGTAGVLAAYSKGAPVRIISAESTGAADLFWYVKSDSPLKSIKDADGRTVAFSTVGSSTNTIVKAFVEQYKLSGAKPTATGGPPATLTQVMSGQIDIGWAAPPFGLDQIESNQIRIIASGNDAEALRGQTVRVNIANAAVLKSRKPVIDRFMAAYRETIDWMYASPDALKTYAEWTKISEAKAKIVRDSGFYPNEALNPDKVSGLEALVREAVELKFIAAPLSKEQLSELIQIPPR